MDWLTVSDLHVSYGLSKILHGVSIDISRGEVISLLGRNGVGKTTTIRGIMGLTPPRRGSVVWKGRHIEGRPPHLNALNGIGFVPEDRRIFSGLTVWENLDVAKLPPREGIPVWDEDRVFELFPDLKQFRGRRGGVLSGGQQQMLAIARTLMGKPSEGLAPLVVSMLEQKVRELKEAGLSIILAEQNLDFVLSLSDRCYILKKGTVVYSGTVEELRARPDIQGRYLQV